MRESFEKFKQNYFIKNGGYNATGIDRFFDDYLYIHYVTYLENKIEELTNKDCMINHTLSNIT